ncbi:MAG: hypothetical protein Q9225_007564, partial [Loekoesia sp. 1 TL-2023]
MVEVGGTLPTFLPPNSTEKTRSFSSAPRAPPTSCTAKCDPTAPHHRPYHLRDSDDEPAIFSSPPSVTSHKDPVASSTKGKMEREAMKGFEAAQEQARRRTQNQFEERLGSEGKGHGSKRTKREWIREKGRGRQRFLSATTRGKEKCKRPERITRDERDRDGLGHRLSKKQRAGCWTYKEQDKHTSGIAP